MKRTALMALVGATFLIPVEVDAQRQRARHAPPSGRVAAPVSARLANCRAPRNGRAYTCPAPVGRRVVYRYSGDRFRAGRPAWISAGWGRIHMVPVRAAFRGRVLNQRDLREMLGHRTVRRIRDHARRHGLNGALRGHWFESRRTGAILTLTVRGVDVAELVDFDFDGRVDEVLLREFRTRRWSYSSWW